MLRPVPRGAPFPLTHLVGREGEIGALEQCLSRVRLVTLSGPGGVGKTRLAVELARRLGDKMPDGAWLADLAPLGAPELVAQRVASLLGAREEASCSLLTTLPSVVRDGHLLLVLDSCEHVLGGCAELARALLRSCPHVRILATSREPLGVEGETVWRVPPLPTPDPGCPGTAAELARCESVRLFLDRAQLVLPGFRLGAEALETVGKICRQLDGLPLAIELAAAGLDTLSVSQIATRLADRFQLLSGGEKTTLPRHRTLQATLDWSHNLLSPPEQIMWRRLSVFAGSFSLAAAESVGGFGTIAASEVLDLLASLIRKSLVGAREEGLEQRYRWLETVRQYGEAKLRASGEESAVRRRHLDWFRALAEQAEGEWEGPEQAAWLERLDQEHDNLRAALEWSRSADAESGLQMAAALRSFWLVRGYLSEGRRHLQGLLDLVPGPSRARALAAQGAGTLALWQGDYAVARSLYEESLHSQRQQGDGPGTGLCLNLLGNIARHQGDFAQAQTLYAESLALARQAGDRPGIARALTNLANVICLQGEYKDAGAMYTESLSLSRELGDPSGEARTLNNLGGLATHQGDFGRALGLYEKSLRLSRILGDKRGTALTLNNLGLLRAYQGDYEAAAACHRESMALAQALGDRRDLAISLYDLGFVKGCQGRYAEAAALHQQSLTLRRQLGDRWGTAWSLEGLAMVAAGRGQAERAARLAGAAAGLRAQLRCPQPPAERGEYDRHMAVVRATLGAPLFRARWEEGNAMALAQAVAYALDEHGPVDREAPACRSTAPVGGLTARQVEIVRLVAAGYNNKEMAACLFLSPHTVDTHLRNIFNKLGISSRAKLVAWAAQRGLVEPDGQP